MSGRRFAVAGFARASALHAGDEDFTNRCCRRIGITGPRFRSSRRISSRASSIGLSHYPPVAAEANQFGIAPHSDANFMTSWHSRHSRFAGTNGDGTGSTCRISRALRGERGRHAARWATGASCHAASRVAAAWALVTHPSFWHRISTRESNACRPVRVRQSARWEPISYEDWITW